MLPESAFSALGTGAGSPVTIRLLREVQQDKHLMLLYEIARAAGDADRATRALTAFQAGCELLDRIRAGDDAASDWLLGLPHLGSWAHDCLLHLETGSLPDLAYLACLVAAAATRAGVPFDLDVPVRDGRLHLPGLGFMRIPDGSSWTRLRCDGERLTAGRLEADRRRLIPDDGSGGAPPQWCGAPAVRVAADGLAWTAVLEVHDRYLDRYSLPMAMDLPTDQVRLWRDQLRAAWQILVWHHRQVAEPIADAISVIVPLAARSHNDLVSATSPAAFGAVAMSRPPDPVTLAETLVHEFQHVKLCGLMDMVPLVEPGGEKVYAPWRTDPRPAGGLLQGAYAHLGIAGFWKAQQHAATGPDEILRAQVLFARWQPAIGQAVATLQETGRLTPAGERFAEMVRTQGSGLAAEPVSGEAHEIAAAVSLDHWLTWQVRNVAVDAGDVARLAAAYRRGEPFTSLAPPRTWAEDGTRTIGSTVRSQLLDARYLDPARYHRLLADPGLPLSEPDRLLLRGETSAAIQGYRHQIAQSGHPLPDAWTGLALALRECPGRVPQQALNDWLPVILELHAYLDDRTDPLELAGWFA
jgi:HEXXH motif-containing protein